jgi:hypothetical protein
MKILGFRFAVVTAMTAALAVTIGYVPSPVAARNRSIRPVDTDRCQSIVERQEGSHNSLTTAIYDHSSSGNVAQTTNRANDNLHARFLPVAAHVQQAKPKTAHIRQPIGPKSEYPAVFVSVIHVPDKKRAVNDYKVEVEVSEKDVLDKKAEFKVLLMRGHEKSSQCAFFIFVDARKIYKKDALYQETFRLSNKDGIVFEASVKDFKLTPIPEFVKIQFPPEGYVITGSECQYFVPFGVTTAPISSATLGGANGLTTTDPVGTPSVYIWFVEFFGLGIYPGSGTNYDLKITNVDGDVSVVPGITIDCQ